MFLKGKPDGIFTDSYAGQDVTFDAGLGLGASVVMTLLHTVPDPKQNAIYFDNFFISHKLMIKLRQLGFHATGTIREPRLVADELGHSCLMHPIRMHSFYCQ